MSLLGKLQPSSLLHRDLLLLEKCTDPTDPGRRTEKSVAELERLCQQREAINFVYPSTSHGRNKVRYSYHFM